MSTPKNEKTPQDDLAQESRKLYTKPEIVHELELETRAGSPIPPAGIDPLDLTGSGSSFP